MLAMDHVEAPLLASLLLPGVPHIVVAGAYKGDTVRFLLHHYPDAYIWAYEPQTWALEQVPDDPRVARRPYALVATGPVAPPTVMHSYGTDACSLVAPVDDTLNTRARASLKVVDAIEALERYRNAPLSLMVLNIEGYEYTLLPYLFENGIVPVRLLVQFHHTTSYESAAFAGVQAMLQHTYSTVRDVGKGWCYCV